MKELTFQDRTVKIESLYQYHTYAELIEGIPTDKLNQRILDKLPSKALGFTYTDKSYLIEPIQKEIEYEGNYPFGKPMELPPIVCIMGLKSYNGSTKENGDYSELTLVWFQEEFCFPIDSKIKQKISEIDWSLYCSDHLWEDL